MFDAVDTVKQCLPVFTAMLETMRVLPDNMLAAAKKGFINATDCADYLTKKGVPFRGAYKAVGQLVYACTAAGKTLEELTLEELQAAHPLFEADVYEAIDLHTCVSQRNSYGGPSVAGTTKQLELINTFLKEREGV